MYLTKCIYYVLATEEERRSKSLTSSQNSSEMWVGLSPTAKRKRMDLEKLEEEANELLSYFNDRNIDALLKVTRHTLETIRKRIHASSTLNFLGGCIVVHCSFRLSKKNVTVIPHNCINKTLKCKRGENKGILIRYLVKLQLVTLCISKGFFFLVTVRKCHYSAVSLRTHHTVLKPILYLELDLIDKFL